MPTVMAIRRFCIHSEFVQCRKLVRLFAPFTPQGYRFVDFKGMPGANPFSRGTYVIGHCWTTGIRQFEVQVLPACVPIRLRLLFISMPFSTKLNQQPLI